MKWMIKFVFVAAALWSGYWYFGAKAQERAYLEFLSQSRDQGWVAESRHLGVSGFPNRFDTTLTDLNFADPTGRWRWQGAEFQIMALSYQPNHIIMAWPGEQRLQTPFGALSVRGDLLRASLVVAPQTSLPLSRFRLEGEGVALETPGLGQAQIATLTAALFQDDTTPRRYRLGLDLKDMVPGAGGVPILPARVESLHLSSYVTLDRELDRSALQGGQLPALQHIGIERIKLVWGESELVVSGDLQRENAGNFAGELHFSVENWQPLFELFRAISGLSSTQTLTLRRELAALAEGGKLGFILTLSQGQAQISPRL